MPRKRTTKKSAKNARPKRVVKRTRGVKTAKAVKPTEGVKSVEPVMARPAKKETEGYLGISYDTWINIILVIAIILIIGILAGVGSLVQRTYSTKPPEIAPQQQNLPTGYIKTRAQSVLNVISNLDPRIDSVNVTKVQEAHGVYEVNITFDYQGVKRPGVIFISKDGKFAFLRGFEIDEFLQRYNNATVVGTATVQ